MFDWIAGLVERSGDLLEDRYQAVAGWVNPTSNLVVGALVLLYLYRVVTFCTQEPLVRRGTH